MWINLDEKELEVVKFALSSSIGDGPSVEGGAEIIKKIEGSLDGRRKVNLTEACYRNAVETSDELEVDEDAIVSMGGDPGAWVHAWVWVTNEQAGVEDPDDDEDDEPCITCGAVPGTPEYGTVGDGFDGECPSCADKTDQKLNPENYE